MHTLRLIIEYVPDIYFWNSILILTIFIMVTLTTHMVKRKEPLDHYMKSSFKFTKQRMVDIKSRAYKRFKRLEKKIIESAKGCDISNFYNKHIYRRLDLNDLAAYYEFD